MPPTDEHSKSESLDVVRAQVFPDGDKASSTLPFGDLSRSDTLDFDPRAYTAVRRLYKKFHRKKWWFVAASVHPGILAEKKPPTIRIYVSSRPRRARRLERDGYKGFAITLVEVQVWPPRG